MSHFGLQQNPPDADEPADIRLKRLRSRAWHRGFREHDFLMGGFADTHLASLTPAELDQFEALLQAPDQDCYQWIMGQTAPPAEYQGSVLARLSELSPHDRVGRVGAICPALFTPQA